MDLSWAAARSDLQLVTTTSYNRNSYSIKETVEDSSAFPVKKLFVEDCRFVTMQRCPDGGGGEERKGKWRGK